MGRPNVPRTQSPRIQSPRTQSPRTQSPHTQGMYDYQNKSSAEYNALYKGSDSSQGIVPVSPSYANNVVSEAIDYPQRPDSNNSSSAYSDTSTKYSGRSPYPYPPQHQYPYQQMPPPSGFNNADPYVDPYSLIDEYQQDSKSNPYNHQNDPYSNSNQYYSEANYDNSNYNHYPPSSPQNAQFAPIENRQQTATNAPSQRTYQQNRPYNNKGGRY